MKSFSFTFFFCSDSALVACSLVPTCTHFKGVAPIAQKLAGESSMQRWTESQLGGVVSFLVFLNKELKNKTTQFSDVIRPDTNKEK